MSHLAQVLSHCLLKNAARVAVKESGRQYTYRELGGNVYALAKLINQIGEDRVAVIGEPSYLSIVCVWGAVLGRTTYIPIDPQWPTSRVLNILRKSKIKTIIGNSLVLEKNHIDLVQLEIDCFIDVYRGNDRTKVSTVKVIDFDLENFRENSYSIEQEGSSICYIMYTSGSTGGPKGVMVTTKAFEYFLDWFASEFAITESDRFAYISSLGFGASLRQIFSPLFSGATIVCFDNLILKNPVSLLKNLQENEITIFNSPPIVIKQLSQAVSLLSSEEDRTLSHLRYVLVGGDIFPAKILQGWYKSFQHEHSVVNLYGSTESVINAAFYKTTPEMPLSLSGLLPVGRPRPHFSFMILDEDNRPILENGKTGVLFIKSDAISIGYHNDQEKTQETFVIIDGNRLYNTGDLAQRLSSGDYLVLGRKDRQIQIYGNRVELGEIESTLGTHPQITGAFVVDFKDKDRDEDWHKIYAFILCKEDRIESIHLKSFLKENLPSYMIPHGFEFIDSIPTTQSGKVDYTYLKEMAQKKYLVNETQQEEGLLDKMDKVKAIWLRYLKGGEIGIDDSFFDIGGDSVTAVEIYHDLCKEFAIRLDPFVFYNSSTIRKLTEEIINAEKEKALPSEKQSTEFTVQKQSFSAKVFFLKASMKLLKIMGMLRSSFHFSSKAGKKGPLSAQQKFFAHTKFLSGQQINGCLTVPIKGHVDLEQLKKVLSLTINAHDALRTIFIGEQQIVLPPYYPEIMFYDLTAYGSSEKERAIEDINQKILYKEFDFSNLPLFNVILIKKSENEFLLIFCANHIIVDGWSIQIFLSFLNECYGFLEKGTSLPPVPSYLDYTLSYKKFCREHYRDNDNFWREKLSQLNEYNAGPMMEKHEENPPSETLNLNSEQIEKMKYLLAKYNVTSFYLLMALWSRAFAKVTESSKITFFTTFHNRSFKFEGLQRMIGSVARGVPIFVDFSRGDDFKDVLENTKKSYLESLSKIDFNIYKHFVTADNGKLSRSRFTILFNYIDCRQLSQRLENTPFDIDTNNCKIQISRDQSSSHPAYLFFSIHHHLDHVGLQAHGNCPQEYKQFMLNSIGDQIMKISTQIAQD